MRQTVGRTRLRAAGAALFYAGVFVLMQLAVGATAVILMLLFQARPLGTADIPLILDRLTETVTEQAIALTAVANLCTLLTLFLIVRCRGQRFYETLRLTPVKPGTLLPLLPLGLALNVLLSVLLSLLPQEVIGGYQESAALVSENILSLLSAFLIVGLAPLTEEIVFRGFVYDRLKRAFPLWAARALQAALFALMHGQPLWMLYTFVMGWLLAVLSDRFGSLRAAVALHMSFNAGSYVVALLPVEAAGSLLLLSAAAAPFCVRKIWRATGPDGERPA